MRLKRLVKILRYSNVHPIGNNIIVIIFLLLLISLEIEPVDRDLARRVEKLEKEANKLGAQVMEAREKVSSGKYIVKRLWMLTQGE